MSLTSAAVSGILHALHIFFTIFLKHFFLFYEHKYVKAPRISAAAETDVIVVVVVVRNNIIVRILCQSLYNIS